VEEKEIKQLLDKFNKGECNAAELQLLQTLMDSLDGGEAPAVQEPATYLKQEIWNRVEKRSLQAVKVRRLNTTLLKIAAIVLITLFASLFFARVYRSPVKNSTIAYQLITAPKGQMKQVALPDSSIVYLNAASTIKVPVEFAGNKREIYLVNGEAYFDIKHDAKKPFLVHSGNVVTQVLGTSFNIKFYKELSCLQVFVNSGKVEVHDQKHTLGMYTPQQQVTYNKVNESFTRQSLTDNHSLSWMHDELILDNVSFKEVAVYVQNRYNVSFKYAGKRLSRQHYSVRFANKLTINQVIDILQLIDGKKYSLKGNTVIIN
jgi:transmembrane sensor